MEDESWTAERVQSSMHAATTPSTARSHRVSIPESFSKPEVAPESALDVGRRSRFATASIPAAIAALAVLLTVKVLGTETPAALTATVSIASGVVAGYLASKVVRPTHAAAVVLGSVGGALVVLWAWQIVLPILAVGASVHAAKMTNNTRSAKVAEGNPKS